MGQPKPDEEGDGNSHTNVGHAFIARAATNNTSDKFIVDTGCIAYAFVKQYVDLGKIELVHCRTQVMVADMLTKPLNESDLKKLSDLIFIVDG